MKWWKFPISGHIFKTFFLPLYQITWKNPYTVGLTIVSTWTVILSLDRKYYTETAKERKEKAKAERI